jgi:hypothetical protein
LPIERLAERRDRAGLKSLFRDENCATTVVNIAAELNNVAADLWNQAGLGKELGREAGVITGGSKN